MTKFTRILAVVVTFCVLLVVINTQNEPDAEEPLLRVLSIIPDHTSFAPYVAFTDFRSAYAAAGVEFEDFADFQAQIDEGILRESIWGAVRNITVQLPQILSETLPERDSETLSFGGPTVGEIMPEKMGMDYFDVHYGATFGNLPLGGMIFGGEFDLDRIGEAHLARGFREEPIQNIRAWCHEATSCEGDAQPSLAKIEPFNLFDTSLGRKPAFLGVPGMLAGSSRRDIVTAMADTVNGDAPSLLDAPDYRTLADAILDVERYEGELVQVQFFSSETTSHKIDLTRMYPTDQYDAFAAEWTTYGELPPFELMSVADRTEDNDTLTLLALYYEDPDMAETASAELARRLMSFTSVASYMPPAFGINTLPGNVQMLEPYVFSSSETGHYAAVIPIRQDFRFTLDGEERNNNNRVYTSIHNEIIQQSFYPLWDITLADWYLEKKDS